MTVAAHSCSCLECAGRRPAIPSHTVPFAPEDTASREPFDADKETVDTPDTVMRAPDREPRDQGWLMWELGSLVNQLRARELQPDEPTRAAAVSLTHQLLDILGVPSPPDLTTALRQLVAVVDDIGGYLTPEQQAVLWRARELSK